MDLNIDSPIAALASPPGGSVRGIVRISGNRVCDVLSGWFEPDDPQAWTSAKSACSHPGCLSLSDDGPPIDLPVDVFYWPNRRSYTGQPLIELHLPGSPCLLEAVLASVYRRGARPARPGEFTMRAFLAGKLDLLQAEAVLGVIDAGDHRELQTALAQLAGGVSGQLGQLRRDLLELLADLEAGLDFVDEDIEFVSRREVSDRLQSARVFVDDLLRQTQTRMQSRVRRKVVLAGLPNAGKSTLFNRQVGVNTALISSERGTTRDFLVRAVTWNDLEFDLIDTAGWEAEASGIAAAAQDQRAGQLQQSDLLVWCSSSVLNTDDSLIDDQLFEEARSRFPAIVRLLTKIDLYHDLHSSVLQQDLIDVTPRTDPDRSNPRICAETGAGMSELEAALKEHLAADRGMQSQWLGMTAARCRETIESIATALGRADESAGNRHAGDEIIAVDLREALDRLGVILGVVYTDDILDRIFSKFCIGK